MYSTEISDEHSPKGCGESLSWDYYVRRTAALGYRDHECNWQAVSAPGFRDPRVNPSFKVIPRRISSRKKRRPVGHLGAKTFCGGLRTSVRTICSCSTQYGSSAPSTNRGKQDSKELQQYTFFGNSMTAVSEPELETGPLRIFG